MWLPELRGDCCRAYHHIIVGLRLLRKPGLSHRAIPLPASLLGLNDSQNIFKIDVYNTDLLCGRTI